MHTQSTPFPQCGVVAWPQGGAVWLNFIYIWGILQWELIPPLSLPPVPVWRWFPEGPCGVCPGGSGTGYPATGQGTLHTNPYFGDFGDIFCCMKTDSLHIKSQKVSCAAYINHRVVFFFQLSLKGPPGPLGLAGRPGPLVRHSSDLDQICIISQGLLQPLTSAWHSAWPGTSSALSNLIIMLSMFKMLWNHCRVAKISRFLRRFVLSLFVFCLFVAEFDWEVELHHLML